MKVYGHEITYDIERRALVAVGDQFYLARLDAVLAGLGVPVENDVSNRAADRLIQKWRTAGRIKRDGRFWRKAKP